MTGGNIGEEAIDGEAVYAEYALLHLHILPGKLQALPLRERAFIYACIDEQVKRERKIRKKY